MLQNLEYLSNVALYPNYKLPAEKRCSIDENFPKESYEIKRIPWIRYQQKNTKREVQFCLELQLSQPLGFLRYVISLGLPITLMQ